MPLKSLVIAIVCGLAAASIAAADSLLVGFNTQTPLQAYSAGTYQQDFGPDGASAGVEENGLLYVAVPNSSGSSSTIDALNAKQKIVRSFSIPDLISDGAPGQNGTLWFSGYDGKVYQYTTSGTAVGSFDTGFSSATSIGIASNRSTLYTSEGDSGSGIDVRDSTGKILSMISTPYTGLYGLAYDSSNNSLWAGSFNYIYDFSLTGTVLTTLTVMGDGRTPNGAVHDGLELVDLSTLQSPPPPPPPTVPEPGFGWLTGGLMLAGLVCRKISRRA